MSDSDDDNDVELFSESETESSSDDSDDEGFAAQLTPSDDDDDDDDELCSKLRRKLFDLRLHYNAGRLANSGAALKQSGGGGGGSWRGGESVRHKERFERAVEDAGEDPERIARLRTALPSAEWEQKAAEQKQKKSEAPANPLGAEAAYRAYKRRLQQDMPPFDHAAYRAQLSGAAPFVAGPDVYRRLADDMTKLDGYRVKQSRRRSRQARRTDDDLGATAKNRQLNRWAKKAYADILAPIRDNLERGTAL